MKLRQRNKGFTLIELLVVVAIIAILAAMLLPSLSRARENGKRAQCASNLKQLAMAFHMYADDHNDYLPHSTWSHPHLYNVQGGWIVSAYPYVKNMNVYRCPSDKEAPWYVLWAYGQYAANFQILGWYATASVCPSYISRRSQYNHQTETSLLLDGYCHYAQWTPANIFFRHNTTLNVAYLDGHVGSRNSPLPSGPNDVFWDGD